MSAPLQFGSVPRVWTPSWLWINIVFGDAAEPSSGRVKRSRSAIELRSTEGQFRKQERLLDRFDAWAEAAGAERLDASHRFEPTQVDVAPKLGIDLAREGIGTIFWATGYHPDYSWLDVPVVDRKGRIRHDGGVIPEAPGMYVLGTSLLRRRRSTFISGAEGDTHDIAEHLDAHLAGRAPVVPV